MVIIMADGTEVQGQLGDGLNDATVSQAFRTVYKHLGHVQNRCCVHPAEQHTWLFASDLPCHVGLSSVCC